MKDKKNNVEAALLKRALGYDTKEIVEEFQDEDGDVKLTKRKVTTKNVPPDISAVKMILDSVNENCKKVGEMTEEELKSEKERLLNLLKETDKNENGKDKK